MLKPEEIDFGNYEEMDMPDNQEESTLVDNPDVTREMYQMLLNISRHWENLRDFRERREKNRKFHRGDHYHQAVEHPDTGETMRMDEYISSQGKVPFKNNQVRQIVKNLMGQYRDNDYKPSARARKEEDSANADMMTNVLQQILDVNDAKELDANVFLEYLLSGFAGERLSFDWMSKRNMEEVHMYKTNPTRMFWNTDVQDPRLWDINLIGEIHDTPLDQIIQKFANNETDVEKIRQWYTEVNTGEFEDNGLYGADMIDNIDFLIPTDTTKGRVIEVWKKIITKKMMVHDKADGTITQTDYDQEDIDVMNTERIVKALEHGIVPNEEILAQVSAQMQGATEAEVLEEALRISGQVPLMAGEEKLEDVWHYFFLTPQGNILKWGETPYDHEAHPYCIHLYPMVDGEVWGFVEDILDQQEQINRLITQWDFMIGAGAKGVLLIDEGMIPDGMSPEDFSEQWTRWDGVITYKPKPGMQMPKQITSNSQNAGAQQMLELQLGMLKEISGVNEAIQGQKISGVNTASQYAQMSSNATLSTKDFFESFFNWRKNRDYMVLQVAQQYYDDKRYLNVVGEDAKKTSAYYDPERGRSGTYDIVVGRSQNSPVYRDLIEDRLVQFLDKGLIDMGMYLENSSMPYAEKLNEAIKQKEQELLAMQQQNGLPLEGQEGIPQ